MERKTNKQTEDIWTISKSGNLLHPHIGHKKLRNQMKTWKKY